MLKSIKYLLLYNNYLNAEWLKTDLLVLFILWIGCMFSWSCHVASFSWRVSWGLDSVGITGTTEHPFPCGPSLYMDGGVRTWWCQGSKRAELRSAKSQEAYLQKLYSITSVTLYWPKNVTSSTQIQGWEK